MFSLIKKSDETSIPILSGRLPLVGLGTWKTTTDDELRQALSAAIDSGYRHIDCAQVYGNEAIIGEYLQSIISEGKCRREDLFITSKVWNTFHAKEHVRPAFEKTLRDLRLEYLDLYLIHWPTGFKYDGANLFPRNEDGTLQYSETHYRETWEALEELVEAGLVRNIGLSNFNRRQIEEVLSFAKVRPSVLQCESHPFLPQTELIQFCKDNNIAFTAFSPLGSPDRPWAKPDDVKLLEHPEVVEMAKRYGKSVAQILIRFHVQRGVSVIPKSANRERVAQNIQVFDFSISPEDMNTLLTKMPRVRFCLPMAKNAAGEEVPRDAGHPFYPFADAY